MAFSLNPATLFSREVRQRIGARTLSLNPLQKVTRGGKLFGIINFGGSFSGFLSGLVLSQLPNMFWSLTSLWDIFTTGFIELYYFDWNIPDDRLDQQARQQWQAYGAILGGTAGSAIGFFVCGVVPASSMMVFNEELGTYVLREVGEEAFEELTANFSMVLRLSIRNLARQSLGWLYKGARRWLKDPSNPIGNLVFGSRADEVRQTWGENNAPSWSFAQAVEERVEKIPNQFWQQFTEELIEEALDACIEAGYVVAQSVESFYARQRLAETFTRDRQRVVEVQPNRDNEREKIVLAGPEPEVRAQLPAVLAQHQLIESRDVGQIVGEPLDDYVRARPFDNLRLKFKMFSLKGPPYTRRGQERLVEVTVTVPNVDRTRVDWDRLRAACGGANGYLWGRFRCHARLEDGHSISLYGATPDEAEDRLRAFLALSESSIKTISTTEEKKEGERLTNPKLFKETTRVYPGFVSVFNRERTLRNDIGRPSLNGNYIMKEARLDLWRSVKPPDFEEKIIELLRRST